MSYWEIRFGHDKCFGNFLRVRRFYVAQVTGLKTHAIFSWCWRRGWLCVSLSRFKNVPIHCSSSDPLIHLYLPVDHGVLVIHESRLSFGDHLKTVCRHYTSPHLFETWFKEYIRRRKMNSFFKDCSSRLFTPIRFCITIHSFWLHSQTLDLLPTLEADNALYIWEPQLQML